MSLTSMQRNMGHNTDKKFEMDPMYLKSKLPNMPNIGSIPSNSDLYDKSVNVGSASPVAAIAPSSKNQTTIQSSTNISVTVASDFSLYPDDINITICGSTLNGLKLYPTPIVIREAGRPETEEVKPPAPEVPAPVLRTGRSGSKLALALKQNSQPDISQNADPNNTGQDNEDELAALMAASSTIKGNKKKQSPQVPNPAAIRKKKLKELKDAQLLISMIDPEKEYPGPELDKSQKLASSFFYLMKDRMEENNDIELFDEIVQTMGEFDGKTPVTEFYTKITSLLKNYPELAQQFIIFLHPEQAWECGKFFEYIKIENMRKFVKKIKAYFAKQPQFFRLVFAALENLSDNENVTLEEVKSTIIPLLKGNSVLIDSFLMLIPQGRPPESLMSLDVEDMDFDSDGSGNEEEKLVLPNQPDLYSNDHCICLCHNSTDEKFRTRFFHCVSCGTRFIQGRVYLQTARHSRLANVAFPEDDCQAKRIYVKKIPPKTRGRRPMKKQVEKKEDKDATHLADLNSSSPEAAQSSGAKDPNTPNSFTPNRSVISDQKRSNSSYYKAQKSAARSLDMSSTEDKSSLGIIHLSEHLHNHPQGIYPLDQEFVTVDAFNHNQMVTDGKNILSDLGCRMVSSTLENVSDGLGAFDYNASESVGIDNGITRYSANDRTLDLFDLQGAVPLENVACVPMETDDGDLCPAENGGDFITLEVYNNNVEMGTLLNAQNIVVKEPCADSHRGESVMEVAEPMDTSYALPLPVHQNNLDIDSHSCSREHDSSVSPQNNFANSSIADEHSNTLIPEAPSLPVATNINPSVVELSSSVQACSEIAPENFGLRSTVNCRHAEERITLEKSKETAKIIVRENLPENLSADICVRPLEILLPSCEKAEKKDFPSCERVIEMDEKDSTANRVTMPERCEKTYKNSDEKLPVISPMEIMPDIPKESVEEIINTEGCDGSNKVPTPNKGESTKGEIVLENPVACDGTIMNEAIRREPLPWTKDEDKVILLEVQRGYCLDKTFQNMTGLPDRSLAEIRERFQMLMRMLQEMTHR